MLDQTKIVQDSSGIVGVFEQKHAAQSVYYARMRFNIEVKMRLELRPVMVKM